MQTKKEMLTFSTLILVCVTLIIAVGFSKEAITGSNSDAPAHKTCCQNKQQNSSTSPWNFITQGIFHLSV